MRVDAHQHYWRLARGDYAWLTPDFSMLYRDFLPADLAPELRRAGVDGTVLVQAATTDAETDFLLQLAAADASILGVVGWLDMLAADASDRLRALARNPLLKGVRPMLQDIPDVDWMLQPQLDPCFRALIELDLAFDALVRPAHLPNLLRLSTRYPELRVVIDHGAKPEIARGAWAPWSDELARIAEATSACCKLSGLVTEAAPDWQPEHISRYGQHVLTNFGSERVLWGSDWPVLLLAGDYPGWWALTHELLAPFDAQQRAAILGDNAVRFYRLQPRKPAT